MQTSKCSGKSVAGYCTGPTDLQCCVEGGGGGISRDTIIARAQDWVNRRIPYSQTKTTGTIIAPVLSVEVFSSLIPRFHYNF
jgi:hypothetical protein